LFFCLSSLSPYCFSPAPSFFSFPPMLFSPSPDARGFPFIFCGTFNSFSPGLSFSPSQFGGLTFYVNITGVRLQARQDKVRRLFSHSHPRVFFPSVLYYDNFVLSIRPHARRHPVGSSDFCGSLPLPNVSGNRLPPSRLYTLSPKPTLRAPIPSLAV